MSEEKAIIPQEVLETKNQVQIIQHLMKEVLQGPTAENPAGVHYGKIPGCGDKMVLLQAGAQKINVTFGLHPIIDPAKDILTKTFESIGMPLHREHQITVHMMNNLGQEVATGVGSCSTMESKYMYRTDYLGAIPNDYKEKKALYKEQGFGCKKTDKGEWVWCNFRAINPNIADQYNTVLKIAKKRASVDGTINATASSDIFTQDLDDMAPIPTPEAAKAQAITEAEVVEAQEKPKTAPKATPEPVKPATTKPAAAKPGIVLSIMDWTKIDKFQHMESRGKQGAKLTFGDIIMYCSDETKVAALDIIFKANKEIQVKFDNSSKFKQLHDFKERK